MCGILVTTESDRVVKVRGDRDHPLSAGYTCQKGRSLGKLHHDPGRLDRPAIGRGAERRETSWLETLDDLGRAVREVVDRHGPDAVGVYLGNAGSFDAAGRRMGSKFVRSLGSRSVYSAATVDAPAKPYVAELVSGHPALFSPIVDYDRATLSLFVGTNPIISHGHTTGMPNPRARLQQLAGQGELWVVDPRLTETAEMATRHLQPRPGTDHIWLAALIRELLSDARIQEIAASQATGLDGLRTAVEPYDLDSAARRCGVDPTDLTDLLAAIRRHGRVAVQSGTGVTMAASANVVEWLLWALQIITDSIDRPGGSWLNPGFLRATDTKSSAPSDGTPGPGPASRPELPQRLGEYPCAALMDEIESGNLRVLFVCGGSLLTALPDSARVSKALQSLEVLAVADVVETSTTAIATHVLPSLGQLERADLPHVTDMYLPMVATQYTPAVVAPGGERKAIWWVFAQLAERVGLGILSEGRSADSLTDDDILEPMTRGGRATLDELRDAAGPVVDRESAFGWVSDRMLPPGGWRLSPEPVVRQLMELEDPPPLVFTPRRQRRHLNATLAREGTSDGREDEPELLLNPEDARDAGVADGEKVRLISSHGEIVGVARIEERLRRGCVSVPHGFEDVNVNRLTTMMNDVDPLTGMVLLSGTAVSLVPA